MIIYNSFFIPGKWNFTFWPFIFIRLKRKEYIFTYGERRLKRLINHEKIHIQQQKEFLIIGLFLAIIFLFFKMFIFAVLSLFLFYVVYFINYLFNVVSGIEKPYESIIFEKEAYMNEANLNYLKERVFF